VEAPDVTTAVKTRILAGELHAQKQQVARIDRSYTIEAGSPVLEELSRRVEERVDRSNAVIISDYGMGVVPGPVSEIVIRLCRKRETPVVVDSRFRLTAYTGATVATPNEIELFEAMKATPKDHHDLVSLAKKTVSQTRFDGLIITRGSKGMLLCEAGGGVTPVGIVGTRDVTDVTGAGDTVAAAVALSLASRASLAEAAEMATYAASIVVMKRGTATMSPEELVAVREKHPAPRDTGEFTT
jgi:rfaE bifunctional protein kinase chain/domain